MNMYDITITRMMQHKRAMIQIVPTNSEEYDSAQYSHVRYNRKVRLHICYSWLAQKIIMALEREISYTLPT